MQLPPRKSTEAKAATEAHTQVTSFGQLSDTISLLVHSAAATRAAQQHQLTTVCLSVQSNGSRRLHCRHKRNEPANKAREIYYIKLTDRKKELNRQRNPSFGDQKAIQAKCNPKQFQEDEQTNVRRLQQLAKFPNPKRVAFCSSCCCFTAKRTLLNQIPTSI